MLRLDGIEVALGGFRMAADFALDPGSATAVIGPSGGGKSTLLNAIAGFVPLAAGRVLWNGEDLTDLPPARRPITLVFQEHNLFAHLTVFQNVGLGLRPDLKLAREDRVRTEGALEAVGLDGFGSRRPEALSGGQRSRVALARALLRQRPILMLDEPFAALGPALRVEMLDLVGRIRAEQDATLILVTHDPEDALRLTEGAVVVAEGRAAPPRPTAALLADPPAALRTYLG